MHDLRLKVLRESGKTLSKKARSRPDSARASATHTPSHSPAHSRAGSRYASEEENNTDSDELDDSLTMSTLSNRSDDPSEDGRGGNWEQRLQDRIAELQDRKRSSAKGREAALATYAYLLRHHYARKQVAASAAGIMDALLKSVRGAGAGVEERRLAVEALGVTVLTCPSDRAFDATADVLRGVCRDADDDRTKAAAVNALAAGLIYGNGREAEGPADEGAALELLEFLLEIVRTDGESVGAENSADVVVAALQAWGYVATFVEDLDEQVDEALDQFVEQLDSTDVEVQTAAGADIALLFEASRRREDDGSGPYNLRYDPKKLVGRMSELAKQSSKSISRKDRRHLRTNFSSIVTSLETGKGPGYATSGRPSHNPHAARRKGGDPEEGFREFGYRDKLRVGDDVWTIETWSGSARIDMLRTMLGGGFQVHLVENEEVAGDVLGELGADGDEDDEDE